MRIDCEHKIINCGETKSRPPTSQEKPTADPRSLEMSSQNNPTADPSLAGGHGAGASPPDPFLILRTDARTVSSADLEALRRLTSACHAKAAARAASRPAPPPVRLSSPMPAAAVWAIEQEANRGSVAHAPGGGLLFRSSGDPRPFQSGACKRMRADHKAVMDSATPLGRKFAKNTPSNSMFVAGSRGQM